jgi:4-oxalocrotonate tautomerase
MPFVIVEMWEGRTPDQKKQLAKDITEAFVKNSIPAEAVQIILKDNPKSCWAQGGKLASEK